MTSGDNQVYEWVQQNPYLALAGLFAFLLSLLMLWYVKDLEESHNVFVEILEQDCANKCLGNTTYQLIINQRTGKPYKACSCELGFINRNDHTNFV